MQISAVQNQSLNTVNTLSVRKISHSPCITNDSINDIFSSAKSNDVSFKGCIGAKFAGAGIGLGAGVIAAVFFTGGLALPFIAGYYGTLGIGTAVGIGVGHAVDKVREKLGQNDS